MPQDTGCVFGGLGSVGPCGTACRVWINGKIADKPTVYFHELGHNLGLNHASYMNDQYGDYTDAMGYCCQIRCFAAPHSYRLKWSQPTYKYTVPLQSQHTHNLKPGAYILVEDIYRRELLFIQFRVPNVNRYEKDLARAVNMYTLSNIESSMSQFQGALTQKGQMWYNVNGIMSVTVDSISDQKAQVTIRPLTHVMYLNENAIPL